MGLFSSKKKKEEQQVINDSNSSILTDTIKNGVYCILFIPINALLKSLTVLKPEGFKGYFIVKIPALYPDGSIRYFFKEEFMLWNVANYAVINSEHKGRTCFFMGFEQLIYDEPPNRYFSPKNFYQNDNTLFRLDTDEKLEFSRPSHSPSLELTYIPADHNIHFNRIYSLNFHLVANLHPLEKRGDPSGFISSFEQWKDLHYPSGGKDLQALFDRYIQEIKDSLK